MTFPVSIASRTSVRLYLLEGRAFLAVVPDLELLLETNPPRGLRRSPSRSPSSSARRSWLQWSTNAPFRAQQGKVCLYAGSFPTDPTAAVAWTWDAVDQPNPFNTGQTWGSGWCAAYIAQTVSPYGLYVYFVQTPLTTDSSS